MMWLKSEKELGLFFTPHLFCKFWWFYVSGSLTFDYMTHFGHFEKIELSIGAVYKPRGQNFGQF